MENLEIIVHLLFKRVNAQDIICSRINYKTFDEKEFLNIVSSYILNYSESELLHLINYYKSLVCENTRKSDCDFTNKLNVFETLSYCAFQFLHLKNNEILCYYSMMIEWRKVSLELGEDIFVTAFLAQKMSTSEVYDQGFLWKRILNHDNQRLNNMLGKGYSENHFHLNGSAPIFHISWISLMNNISASRMGHYLTLYDKEKRNVNIAYKSDYFEVPLFVQALQAALIRLLLFCRLTNRSIKIGQYFEKTENLIELIDFKLLCGTTVEISKVNLKSIFDNFDSDRICISDCIAEIMKKVPYLKLNSSMKMLLNGNIGSTKIPIKKLKKEFSLKNNIVFTDLLKNMLRLIPHISLEEIRFLVKDKDFYNKIWNQKTIKNVVEILQDIVQLKSMVSELQSLVDAFRFSYKSNFFVDYMLQGLETSNRIARNSNYIFSGERWFMYTIFCDIYQYKQMSEQEVNLFYAYLVLKENIRGEFIQSNTRVGFKNFHKYQVRKGQLLADQIYRNSFVRTAVADNFLVKDRMKKLEIRIAPYDSVENNRKGIEDLDNLLDIQHNKRDSYFYTIHFIKREDISNFEEDLIHCRNYNRRKKVEKQAKAIAQLREQYPLIGRRILGIDAASNEIGCRPEVFSSTFRYLKEHRYSYLTNEGLKNLPQLYATYHVGEDFLDVTDGLRAIEETILFLGMESGDRLGHALALGIDVEEWYIFKNYHILLPKQDYLDNLMWIYHKLWKYKIDGFENLKEKIQEEFNVLFSEIYSMNFSEGEQKCIACAARKQGYNYGKLCLNGYSLLHNYYNAWMLRGDSPEFYLSGYFDENAYIKRHNHHLLNHKFPTNYEIRYIPEVAALYYLYHFNRNVRREGKKPIEVTINKQYIKAVAEIQKQMQKEIAERGISIETNPSSNILIGTFRQYNKHPIVRFYNKGLVHDTDKLKECPQLHVSINTDDQGIFNTSLENEYALIARSLELLTDEDGRPLYNKDDIYDWLDKIRDMGNEQSFGYISDLKEPKLYYD